MDRVRLVDHDELSVQFRDHFKNLSWKTKFHVIWSLIPHLHVDSRQLGRTIAAKFGVPYGNIQTAFQIAVAFQEPELYKRVCKIIDENPEITVSALQQFYNKKQKIARGDESELTFELKKTLLDDALSGRTTWRRMCNNANHLRTNPRWERLWRECRQSEADEPPAKRPRVEASNNISFGITGLNSASVDICLDPSEAPREATLNAIISRLGSLSQRSANLKVTCSSAMAAHLLRENPDAFNSVTLTMRF